MGNLIDAFRVAILTYIFGIFTSGLIGIIILIIKKITYKREEEAEQT